MIHETLQWAAEAMGGTFHGSHSGAKFTGVSTDTRTLKPGELFFCLVGERDGHDFAARAVDQGAGCIVIDRSHQATQGSLPATAQVLVVPDTLEALGDLAHAWRRRFSIPILAIAGSNGKTTTKELTKCVLETRFRVLATEGNFNNLIGVPKTLFRLDETHEVGVIEVGMNDFGELARLTRITRPDAGLITNIGMEHLEKLGDLAGVQKAEGELFENLGADSVALVNHTDPRVVAIPSAARRIPYGKSGDAVWGEVIASDWNEDRPLRLRVHAGDESTELALHLPGPHHLSNVLAALAVGHWLKVPLAEAKAALEKFQPAPSRGQVLALKSGRRLIDDCYNANPSSTTAALHTLAKLSEKSQSLAVLGEMLELGAATAEGHRMVGESAGKEKIDWLMAVGPNASEILNGARGAGMAPDRLRSFATTEEAVASLPELGAEIQWILVKGSRGMRLEKIVSYLKERY